MQTWMSPVFVSDPLIKQVHFLLYVVFWSDLVAVPAVVPMCSRMDFMVLLIVYLKSKCSFTFLSSWYFSKI